MPVSRIFPSSKVNMSSSMEKEERESAPVYLNQFSINMKSMSMARERERETVCLEKWGKAAKIIKI